MSAADRRAQPRALSECLRAELRRTNYAGRTVTLAEGAICAGAVALLALRSPHRADAPVLAAIGALGLIDDILEPRQRAAGVQSAKGLRGHLGALRRGRVTTGAAKALGIPALALLGAAGAPGRGGAAAVVIDAGLTAGLANLANLLDLRPGRALKAIAPPSALLLAASAAAREAEEQPRAHSGRALAGAALLVSLAAAPSDLGERGMLGDCGANALGAALGTASARLLPLQVRAALLAATAALTLASERVSFSAVIRSQPLLRRVDDWGRRPEGEA